MRFSIKWMLAIVAYAAVACASVAYAGDAWRNALAVANFLGYAAALTAVFNLKGTGRGFAAGYATTFFFFCLAVFGELGAARPFRNAIGLAD